MPSSYRRQRSCGKVIFSQASVILFTGGTHGGGVCMVGEGGVHGGGVCMGRVVCGRGHVWHRACMIGGMHDRGYAWQEGCGGGHVWWGHVWWGHAWQGMRGGGGACVVGETATAADGTHPTGMLSC